MGRTFAKTLQTTIDIAVLATAYALGFLIRFDWMPPNSMLTRLAITLPAVVALKYATLVGFRVTRYAWSYVGLREAVRVFASLALASLALAALRFLVGIFIRGDAALLPMFIPFGVIAIDFTLAFLGVIGV